MAGFHLLSCSDWLKDGPVSHFGLIRADPLIYCGGPGMNRSFCLTCNSQDNKPRVARGHLVKLKKRSRDEERKTLFEKDLFRLQHLKWLFSWTFHLWARDFPFWLSNCDFQALAIGKVPTNSSNTYTCMHTHTERNALQGKKSQITPVI